MKSDVCQSSTFPISPHKMAVIDEVSVQRLEIKAGYLLFSVQHDREFNVILNL